MTKFWTAALLTVCVGFLSLQNSAAQNSPQPYDPAVANSMRAQCNSDCFKRADSCAADAQTAPQPGVCDTRAISCFVSCAKCVKGYADCRTNPAVPGDVMACMVREIACGSEDRKAAETRTDLISFSGGDGASLDGAVVIAGARNENEGVVAELYWATRHHPGWRKTSQALAKRDARRYDQINFIAPDNSQHALYFDITGFFGKL